MTRSPATPLKKRRVPIPSARRQPNPMSAATESQISREETPPLNAGRSTSSVARPSAVVSAIDPNANRTAPATEIRNGLGCIRMYSTIRRRPRPKSPSGAAFATSNDELCALTAITL